MGAIKNAIGLALNFEGAALRREGLVWMEYGRTVRDVYVRKTPVFCAKIAEIFILSGRLVFLRLNGCIPLSTIKGSKRQ